MAEAAEKKIEPEYQPGLPPKNTKMIVVWCYECDDQFDFICELFRLDKDF